MDIDEIRASEKDYHEKHFDVSRPAKIVDVDEIHRTLLLPCYDGGTENYSDNTKAFHELISRDGGWSDKNVVLDYACGDGFWTTYFALTGAKKVVGFDLSEKGIARGCKRLKVQGLTDKVDLFPMDAGNLEFSDNSFDMVIGTLVLHHVIKYPNVFEELYRVMKPGTKAYFMEGFSDFFLWNLWRKKVLNPEAGDVPLYSKEVRQKAHMFSDIKFVGDTFLFSAKRLLMKPNLSGTRKLLLKALKGTDEVLFKVCPPLRKLGSVCYIILTK